MDRQHGLNKLPKLVHISKTHRTLNERCQGYIFSFLSFLLSLFFLTFIAYLKFNNKRRLVSLVTRGKEKKKIHERYWPFFFATQYDTTPILDDDQKKNLSHWPSVGWSLVQFSLLDESTKFAVPVVLWCWREKGHLLAFRFFSFLLLFFFCISSFLFHYTYIHTYISLAVKLSCVFFIFTCLCQCEFPLFSFIIFVL